MNGSQNPYNGQPQMVIRIRITDRHRIYGQNPYYDSYYDQMYSAQQAQMQTGFNLNGTAGHGAALGFDALNTILGRSFLYMFIALLLTGITSIFVVSSQELLATIFALGRVGIIVIFVMEFAIVIACTSAMKRNNATSCCSSFCSYAIINGLTFSVIFSGI